MRWRPDCPPQIGRRAEWVQCEPSIPVPFVIPVQPLYVTDPAWPMQGGYCGC